MASKEDDTLPLPALSLEYSVDVIADEDFIPTSQPLGHSCSKVTRVSGTPQQNQSSNTFAEDPNTSRTAPVDDTLPREAIIDHPRILDKDKSSDFIPDTETKKIHIIHHAKNEPPCRKKLPVFSEDITSQAQSNPLWDTQHFSVLNGSPVGVKPPHPLNTSCKSDKSITEIIVNDSAETVDLEGSFRKGVKSESGAKAAEKLSVECSINSDAGRCEETQIFDSSSVLLLEQPGHSVADQSEKSIKEPPPSQDLYLAKTIDDESDLQEDLLVCQYSPPAVADTTGAFNQEFRDGIHSKENGIPKGVSSAAVGDETSVTMRKMDFKLTVTCFVSFNTKTNKVLQKFISKVNEVPKPPPKPAHWDHQSDCTSDKSKRYSTSSSGSVYSDKHGLPFALSKRVSAVSDQTDSSEEDLGARMRERNKAIGRTPWSNEYLIPMKLDELMQTSIECQQMTERVPPLREPKTRGSADMSPLKETVKSSSSEVKSVGESAEATTNSQAVAENVAETPQNANPVLPEAVNPTKSDTESDSKEEVSKCEDKRDKSTDEPAAVEATQSALPEPEPEPEPEPSAPPQEEKTVQEQHPKEEVPPVVLAAGVPVMARWTDKRYYSGVLRESAKSDRWEVKFDDGTIKTVREDLIIPMGWLKVGSLVFFLDDNEEYTSGQIVDMRQGKQFTFTVELDDKKERVSAQSTELCLSDVMAGIIREKYKPLAGTPRRITDIDFDNVLSGKRRREQSTPSRPTPSVQPPSTETKNTSAPRGRRKGNLGKVTEVPEGRSTGKRRTGLKSEGGHLVEDKVASADSPSENEVGGTPLRRSSKDAKGKAKPRILSYGYEVPRPRRGKFNKWLTEDGIPIPGPSGVKFKKKKPPPKENDSDEPPSKKVEREKAAAAAPPRILRFTRSSEGDVAALARLGEEKGKKRRLDEVAEDGSHKKTTRGDARAKSKSRKYSRNEGCGAEDASTQHRG